MPAPMIKNDDPLYVLLRQGNVGDFNRRWAAGEACDLTNADFRGLELFGWEPAGLDLSGAYFRQADLRGIDFSNCKLAGASIHTAKISGALFPKSLSVEEITLSHSLGTRMRVLA
ncbi:MAG: pentapeptide repeat-containing protein [Ectothiorhodospiraceae bacterium]|nr:pentapeptide repeat-containing protein [Ectothiorhodospiraceae bacterium]